MATLAGVLTGSIAGCTGGDRRDTGRQSTRTSEIPAAGPVSETSFPPETTGSRSTAPSGRTTELGPAATETVTTTVTLELDLREANVMAVVVERHDGDVTFDVTLHHDDDGESGYANWWQVETLAGDRIGRRDLLHAHGTREFTRSDRFAIPDDTTWVVIRGHDQTHGYGGRAMLVNLQTGETRVVFQGSEPESFAEFQG